MALGEIVGRGGLLTLAAVAVAAIAVIYRPTTAPLYRNVLPLIPPVSGEGVRGLPIPVSTALPVSNTVSRAADTGGSPNKGGPCDNLPRSSAQNVAKMKNVLLRIARDSSSKNKGSLSLNSYHALANVAGNLLTFLPRYLDPATELGNKMIVEKLYLDLAKEAGMGTVDEVIAAMCEVARSLRQTSQNPGLPEDEWGKYFDRYF